MSILVIQHDPDKGLGLFTQPLAEAALELDIRFAGHGELALGDHHTAVIALPGVANPVDRTAAIVLDARGAARGARAARSGTRHLPRSGAARGGGRRAHDRLPARVGLLRGGAAAGRARGRVCSADLPEHFGVFQAHNYGFELPPGAVALAGSPGAVQAFRVGSNAWGIQFHPEPTLEMLDAWTGALGGVMEANGVDPEATRRLGRRYVPVWSEHAAAMTRRFAAVVAA